MTGLAAAPAAAGAAAAGAAAAGTAVAGWRWAREVAAGPDAGCGINATCPRPAAASAAAGAAAATGADASGLRTEEPGPSSATATAIAGAPARRLQRLNLSPQRGQLAAQRGERVLGGAPRCGPPSARAPQRRQVRQRGRDDGEHHHGRGEERAGPARHRACMRTLRGGGAVRWRRALCCDAAQRPGRVWREPRRGVAAAQASGGSRAGRARDLGWGAPAPSPTRPQREDLVLRCGMLDRRDSTAPHDSSCRAFGLCV